MQTFKLKLTVNLKKNQQTNDFNVKDFNFLILFKHLPFYKIPNGFHRLATAQTVSFTLHLPNNKNEFS